MLNSNEEKQRTKNNKEIVITGMHVVFFAGILSLVVQAVGFLFFDVPIEWWGLATCAGLLAYSGYELNKRKSK